MDKMEEVAAMIRGAEVLIKNAVGIIDKLPEENDARRNAQGVLIALNGSKDYLDAAKDRIKNNKSL